MTHGAFNQNNNFYAVVLQKCDRNILNQILGTGYTCKNGSDFDDFFKFGRIHFYFLDQYVDVFEYKEPVKKYFIKIENTLDKNNFYINHLNFNPANIETNDALIFGKAKEEKFYIYERNEILNTNNKDKIYMAYNLWMNNKKNLFERQYSNILDVLSDIDGISQSILSIATFINSFINSYITIKDIELLLNFFNISINEAISQKNKKEN